MDCSRVIQLSQKGGEGGRLMQMSVPLSVGRFLFSACCDTLHILALIGPLYCVERVCLLYSIFKVKFIF